MGIFIPIMGRKAATPAGLAGALFSKVQLRVLGLLVGDPDRSFHTSELIRLAGSGSGAVQRELAKLTTAGILTTTVLGNHKLYRANRDSPIFEELHSLIMKTVGLVDPVTKALKPFRAAIDVAFVYGSTAKGNDTAKSDIDLMIVGRQISYADVFAALHNAEKAIGRSINPNVLTPDEWNKRRAGKSAFVTKLLEQPKIFLIGTEHALQGIG